MNRRLASTALLLMIALLPACGTLSGHEVNRDLMAMTMDGARVSFNAPGHCTRPSWQAELRPGPGVLMTVTTTAAGGLGSTVFRIVIDAGQSFAFTSTTGRAVASGMPGVDAFIANASVIPDSHAVRSPMPVDAVMTGQAAAGDHSLYEGEIRTPGFAAKAFVLQLPDAVVNGAPYRFAPIEYRARPFSGFEDACLR